MVTAPGNVTRLKEIDELESLCSIHHSEELNFTSFCPLYSPSLVSPFFFCLLPQIW